MRKEDQQPQTDELESTIFSQHQSSVELRRQQKENKKKERQALAREFAERNADTRKLTRWLALMLSVVVLVCAVVLTVQLWPHPTDRDHSRGYFLSDGTLPEMSETDVLMELEEAYYTHDGSLALAVKFSNGNKADKVITAFSMKVINNNGDTIATGENGDEWDGTFRVPAGDYADLVVYIPDEDVVRKDDSLYAATVEYTITSAIAE